MRHKLKIILASLLTAVSAFRIFGNALTQGDFHLPSLSSQEASTWINTRGPQSPVEHIFSKVESTVRISKARGTHSTADDATSITDNVSRAMTIPMSEKTEAWEGKGEPATAALPYFTDRLYFSLLLRVTNTTDGKITGRVNSIDGAYYTANEKKRL